MKKNLFLFFFMFSAAGLFAQSADIDCGGGRYSSSIFSTVNKTADITFGSNIVTDYSTNINYPTTLKMDFFEPDSDPAPMRPLIILLFGGGFIGGSRAEMEPICIELSKKGYATAAIDYRLVYPSFFNYLTVFNSAPLLYDEVIKASSDLKAAIRYFKRDAATSNTFKIDTNRIIIGGASAGAIAVLQTAYTNSASENTDASAAYAANGGFEGNTDLPAPNNLLPTYNANGIAAVLNIAGGIPDTSLILATDPPIYSAQGDMDEVVPFNYGPVASNGFVTPLSVYGTNLITTRANNIGLKNDLLVVPGGNHTSPGDQPYISQIITEASAFLESIVCNPILPITLSSFIVNASNCQPVLQWKTLTEVQSSHYEIEQSDNGFNFKTVANVASKNVGGSEYVYKLNSPGQQAWFRLKMVDKDGRATYSAIQPFSPACRGSIQIYPNPAHTNATVTGLQAGMQVRVLSVEGKLLWKQNAVSANLQLPMAKFANGLLIVQVQDEKGMVISTGKLIRN